jgi:O-antigen ligase
MNGLFLFLPTIVVPVLNDTFRLFYFFILFKRRIEFSLDAPFLIIISIVILSQINLTLGYFTGMRSENYIDIQHVVTFTLLFPVAYLMAQQLKPQDFKVFTWLFSIDATFVILQFTSGVSTFYTGLDGYEQFSNDTGLMYFSRPYGLGNNASVFAEKLLAFVLIIHHLKDRLNYKFPILLLILISIAGLLNLGRTALVSIVVFMILISLKALYNNINKKLYLLRLMCVIFVLTAIAFTQIDFLDHVAFQFLRGSEQIELAGREIIWENFLNFILNNPFLGNGSVKYFTDYNGEVASGHNSFLMLAATHGVVITLLYFALIIFFINRINYIYIVPIILFSSAQYSIFWGLSFNDIILLYFLRLGNNFNHIKVFDFSSSLKSFRGG